MPARWIWGITMNRKTQPSGQAAKGSDEVLTSVMSRVTTLEKEMAQLHGMVASLQDELLQKESN